MNVLLKVISISIVAAFLSSILKKEHREYSIAIIIVTGLIVIYVCLNSLTVVVDNIKAIIEKSGVENSYYVLILKVIGIAYISEFTSTILSDADETALAKKVEMAGKIIIFIMVIPVFSYVAELVISMI